MKIGWICETINEKHVLYRYMHIYNIYIHYINKYKYIYIAYIYTSNKIGLYLFFAALCRFHKTTKSLSTKRCTHFPSPRKNKPESWAFFVQRKQGDNTGNGTVDGQNPAPPRMMIIPLFTRFYTSQVVQDFFHQQYHHFNIFNQEAFYIPILGP